MNREEKVQAVVSEFLSKDYGETVEHFKISALIEERNGSKEYQYIVQKAQKRLLDCGKMIENVRGVGYKVVDPDDYTNQSAKCVISGARRINKGAKIIQNAPVQDMSPEGLQAYNTIADRMMILQATVAGAKVEINMLSGKRKNPLLAMSERSESVH